MNPSISDSAMHSSSLKMKKYASSQNWPEEEDALFSGASPG